MTGPTIAAFDVDGTLTTRDCVVPFLERLGGRRGILGALARTPLRSTVALGTRDRDRVKEIVVGRVYSGRDVAVVDAVGSEFATEVAATMLRRDVVNRLRWHQDQGHRTVVVSASMRSYLEPLARLLGIDHTICTDVHSTGGIYEDRLLGGNCRAEEKARRLRRWIDAERLDGADIWAYGDSAGDRELLAMAHHPLMVRGTTVTQVPDGGPR